MRARAKQNKHAEGIVRLPLTLLFAISLASSLTLGHSFAITQPVAAHAIAAQEATEAPTSKPTSPDALSTSGIDQEANNPQTELAVTIRIPREALVQGDSFDEYDSAPDTPEEEPGAQVADTGLIEDVFYAEDFADNGYFCQEGFCQEGSYRMFSESSGEIDIIGRGISLQSLFESLGVNDLSAVHEVRFTNATGTSVTVFWEDIVRSGQSPLVATESLVVATDQDALENDSVSGNRSRNTSLLKNTRFRILFDDSSEHALANSDDLRYVNRIEVNPNYPHTGSLLESDDSQDSRLVDTGAIGAQSSAGTSSFASSAKPYASLKASTEAGNVDQADAPLLSISALAIRLRNLASDNPFAACAVCLLVGSVIAGCCHTVRVHRRKNRGPHDGART